MSSSGQGYYFGLTRGELVLVVYLAVFLTMLAFPLYWGSTGWLAIGVGFSIFVFLHMCFIASRCIALPELTSFVACINWVIASAFSYKFPPTFPLYEMAVPPEEYFAYSVPCCIALWVGLHLLLRLQPQTTQQRQMWSQAFIRRDRIFMDGLIVFGFAILFVSPFLPQKLSFLYYILSQLRFVGAFSLLITNTRGWKWRIVVVYISLFAHTLNVGLFYELVLWSGYLMIMLAYIKKWRWRMVFLMPAVLGLIVVVNAIKPAYRASLVNELDMRTSERALVFGKLMMNQVQNYKIADYPIFHQDSITRWNQGWIIARVMSFVPRVEPYAEGETLIEAVMAAVAPRILFPNKVTAASQEIFSRFTGLMLNPGTSMALGIAGEMYANFGKWGGIFGTFLYGLAVGKIFSRFAHLASKNFLWWAWTPTVLLATIEAEWNLVDILNHIIKSLVVLVLFVYLVPAFRKYLSPQFIFTRFFRVEHKPK